MTSKVKLSAGRLSLQEANSRVRNAWSTQSAPPFFGQISFDEKTDAQLNASVRQEVRGSYYQCSTTFREAPYASVWVVLNALAANYGEDGASVYVHIARAIGLDLSDQGLRDSFKLSYRQACRKIGLRLLGFSKPTDIFFTKTGVADAQTGHLAQTFLSGARQLGSPPEEDVAELRHWQRRATEGSLENRTRMRAALANDSHGHYAQLFCHWRAGNEPENRASRAFFTELDRAALLHGIDASRLIAEPDIMWTEHGLALMARTSQVPQTIIHDGMPSRLPANAPWRLPLPWPDSLNWRAGALNRTIRPKPEQDEIFVFAIDTQKLSTRLSKLRSRATLSFRRALLLSPRPFSILSGTNSTESLSQGSSYLAIIDVGPEPVMIMGDGFDVEIARDLEPSIRIEGPIIGRNGSIPLYGSASVIEITSGAEEAEKGRVLRITFADRIQFIENVAFDADGLVRLPLASLGLDGYRDPGRIHVELIVKGAEARSGARAEIIGRFYIWPDTKGFDPEAPFCIDRLPRNFLANTSEHLLQMDNGLSIDPGRGFRHAVLSLQIDECQRDFAIPVRGTQLFHHSISRSAPKPVELGSIIVLGRAERQDSLMVRSTERNVDLWIRGSLVRRPFMARISWEIPPSQISPEAPVDDQIAMIHADGRRELLCRISQPIEPRQIDITLTSDRICARLELPVSCDSIGLEIWQETDEETSELSAISLGGTPLDQASPDWLTATILSKGPDVVDISIDRRAWIQQTGIGLLKIRQDGDHAFERLEDSRGRVFALPLSSEAPAPYSGHPTKPINALARIFATTYQPQCDLVVRQVLGPRLRDQVSKIARHGLYSPLLLPIFARALHAEGTFVSRLDILHPELAPEVFSVGRAAFDSLKGVPHAGRLATLAHGKDLVYHWPVIAAGDSEDTDTLSAWLQHADDLPEGDPLGGRALRQAFLLFRQTAKTSDFFVCLEHDTIGQTLKQVLNVYASSLDALLRFDDIAGADRTGVRLAAYLSSFARAARMKKALKYQERVARRISLPITHVTPATSLGLHAGSELFAYFMLFWDQVQKNSQQQKKQI